ncbi:unnamed protein product [Paramecium primaurelia]|uniref:Uncharacterized protein n=1 Tax=Paramecium primaurelia TaxID=5886 RepID=A0A8S1P6X0_PARPR|nr:unnamed protein product [Paramecium primaurelia]
MIIKYGFTATGRRINKILKDVDKDYSKVFKYQLQKMKTKDMSKKYINIQDSQQKIEHLTKPHNLNKYIKQQFKKSIDKVIEKEVSRIERQEVEDKKLKWVENAYMTEEVKKFEKLLFQKNERLRLIRQEENRVHNHLPHQYLQEQGEIEYLQLNSQHQQYKTTLNQLHNQRITEMRENIKNPYGLLIKSQLLVQYPNLKQTIESHLPKLENNHIDEFVEELKSKVDSSTSLIDWDSVKQFYIGMQQQRDNSLIVFSQHQSSVNVIHDYQNYLMDKFYNNSLQMRTKGQIQFADLTEEECVRYIKYDISTPEILMRLVSTMDQIPDQFTPKIASSILQKLVVVKKDNLALLADDRYRALLNYIARSEYDDQTLSQTILALSLLQPKSIQTVYDKLSYHLYDNLAIQLIPRIKQLSNSQFSMIVRNFHSLPLSKNLQLQNLLVQDIIKNRINNNLSVYEAESFISFLSRPLMNDQNLSIVVYNLTQTLLSQPNSILDIDQDTLVILSSTLLKLEDNKQISSLLKSNSKNLQSAIESCECKHLAQFSLLLSKLDIHRSHDLIQQTKKRFVEIITYRKKEQDEFDIAMTISSLSQIDIKMMYPIRRVNEVILLQTVFNRYPYSYKSANHVPYEKLINLLQSYDKMFTEKSLIIIFHSLITIGHIHKDAFLQSLQQVQDTQYLFPLLIQLNTLDHNLDQVVSKFNQQTNPSIQGVLFYLQAMFYFNKLQISDFEKIDPTKIQELDQTSRCFLMMLITSLPKCEIGQQIYNELILALDPQYIEQKYLLLLSRIQCDHQQGELQLLLTQMRQQATQRNSEIGIEKYLPQQVIQQVADLFVKQGHQVQKNVLFPLFQSDLLIDNKIAFQFISVNEMIDCGGQFQFTGIQKLLRRRTNVNYIIYEEFIRSQDQFQYLKQFL